MKTLYESLLDDEEELLNNSNINIFNIISSSKSEKEFYKHIDTLADACIPVDINNDLSKYKNSFFLMKLFSTFQKKPYGIKIEKYFKKSKRPLFMKLVEFSKGPSLHVAMSNKYTFNELKYEITPSLNSNIVYILPKNIEKQYIEWVRNSDKLQDVEKNKIL